MTHEHVVAKVAKLLRLAEGTSNPNEAAVAAAAAQRLMDEHRISKAEVGSADNADESIAVAGDPLWSRKGTLPTWVGYLASVMARANDCRTYVARGRGFDLKGRRFTRTHLNIVGRESDVQVARYMFAYCMREIERLAKKASRRGEISGRTGFNNFRVGAIDALYEKLRKQKAASRATASSTALVRLDNRSKDVERYMDANLKLRSGGRRSITLDRSARSAGVAAGRSISVNRGMRGGHSSRQLGC